MRVPLLFCVPALLVAQAPTLTFEKVHHDFGKIGPDRKVSYHFKATNSGNAQLNISHLDPSCGCTATVPGKWTLNPGETTDVEVTFNPANLKGLIRKSVRVTSNDAKNPVQTLTFEAEIIQEINLRTNALFFLEVPRTTPRKATVKLESGNGQPVKIQEIKVAGAPFFAGTFHSEGKDGVVEFTFDPRKVPAGTPRGVEKAVLQTGSSTQPTLVVDLQWELKQDIVSTPEKVVWSEASGKEWTAKVVVKHADGKAFTLTGARPTTPWIRVEGLGKKAAQHELTFVLAATAKPGTYNEKVVLTTDDPDQPQVEIRVVASLK